MQYKISHSSYVIGLVESDFPESEINEAINLEIDAYLKNAKNIESLQEWTLEITIVYNNVSDIILCRKNKSNPNAKYKEVIIHIPIPTKDTVDWGVKPEQHIENNWDYKNSNYTDVFNIECTKYNNISSYIIDALRIAIKSCFQLGVTVNKIRILSDHEKT